MPVGQIWPTSICLGIGYGCFQATMVKFSSTTEATQATSLKYLLSALFRKGLLNPGIQDQGLNANVYFGPNHNVTGRTILSQTVLFKHCDFCDWKQL